MSALKVNIFMQTNTYVNLINKFIKIKKFPFGVAGVTSLGMLGIRDAFAPNNCYHLKIMNSKNDFIKSDHKECSVLCSWSCS